ncbi:MAG: cytochrome c [Hyphomonadaceae bacterium]
MRRLVALFAVFATAACAGAVETPPSQQASMAQDGREIAEAECAGCHAVGPYGESPNPTAPVFRTVLARYNAEVLEEELIAGIRVTHPMPDFQFNPQGADALIAYLQSIQQAQD